MQTRTGHPQDTAQRRRIERVIRRRSFAVLSTTSGRGVPHAAGVGYAAVGPVLYVHTMRSSRKALNVAATGQAAMVVPARALPGGPPFTIHFQATASVVAMDDPSIAGLIAEGRLRSITGHGALDAPDGCFLRIEPTGRIHSYGIGVPTLQLLRDPLNAGSRSIDVA